LYNGKSWSKKTKTNGKLNLDGPKFNLVSFTQPINLLKFSRFANQDGFFQRFIVTCPKEHFVYFEKKVNALAESDKIIDMGKVVKAIHDSSVESTPKNPIYLHLSKEAMLVYKEAHDRVVSFREGATTRVLSASLSDFFCV